MMAHNTVNTLKIKRQARPDKVALVVVLVVAGIVYGLISLVNHYLFKTYALDLGLYTHFMYEYAHFRIPDLFMLDRSPALALSDHFDLYLAILSPLVYVFGTYTLLIVQIAAVLLGGWGIYKLISLYTDDAWLLVLATAGFLSSFGIIHTIAYDYHSNVLTTMMLPWLLYFFKRERYGLSSLFVVLFVIGKENMSLWLFFIVTGLMWDYRKDRKAMWHLLGYAVFSLLYFIVINMVVMPALGGNGGGFARYAYLGNSYGEIAKRLLTHPIETLQIMATNTTGLPEKDGLKAEFYVCAMASGMLLTLLKPNYLWMLIPLIGQKMLASDPLFWGISLQYSVEFMPVLVISSLLVIIKLKNNILRLSLSVALLISILSTTFYTIGVPKSKIFVDQLCVYQGRHYRQEKIDAKYARQLIETIPDDAFVCAATMFVPHLALRPYIEDFASVRNTESEYVLITDHYFDFWVNGEKVFENCDEYETLATDGTLYLLHRKP